MIPLAVVMALLAPDATPQDGRAAEGWRDDPAFHRPLEVTRSEDQPRAGGRQVMAVRLFQLYEPVEAR